MTTRRYSFIAVLAITLLASAQQGGAQEPPRRVVSINVCTDQLAMLIAGEGQIRSVSRLAANPDTSTMFEEAKAYPANHGLAEEVFLMKPDLVLAGTFTARTTVELLRRLGFRVEQFAPANNFEAICTAITRIGDLLGRQGRAAELLREFDEGVAELAASPRSDTVAVAYSSNSYTTGAGTLTNAVMNAAGLTNMAAEQGVVGGTRMPLEALLAGHPDLVVTGTTSYDRPALAQENFVHPAFRAFYDAGKVVTVPDSLWICGAPFTLDAVRLLREAAQGTKAR